MFLWVCAVTFSALTYPEWKRGRTHTMLHTRGYIHRAWHYTANKRQRYWRIGYTTTALEHFFWGRTTTTRCLCNLKTPWNGDFLFGKLISAIQITEEWKLTKALAWEPARRGHCWTASSRNPCALHVLKDFSPRFFFLGGKQHERLNASWEADVISLPRCTRDTCPPLCVCSPSYMVWPMRSFRLEQNLSPLPYVLLCFLSLSSHLPGPPSAPRNVISSINETSVILDWSWPEDSGGRRDITFTVVCKRCRGVPAGGGNQRCEPCRSNVRFLPRAAGLQNTTVTVADLLAHTNYTFEIEAQNGVSPLAPKMRQYAAVTITTNQAGEMPQQTSRWIKACAQRIRQELT